MRPTLILFIVLAAFGAGIGTNPGRGAPQAIFFPADFTAAPAGTHWSGFDAPDGRTATITGLFWNQRAPNGTGTARFEVLAPGGAVVCYIDVDCAGAAGTDTRQDCATPYELAGGYHINLQANAGNTCFPDGVLAVVGSM